LPIYHERAVAGVLDIRFGEPHSFQDREVRTYQLMAEQIEAAISQSAQLEQKNQLAADLPIPLDVPLLPEALETLKPAVVAETDQLVAFGTEYRALVDLPGIASAKVWEPAPGTVYRWELH